MNVSIEILPDHDLIVARLTGLFNKDAVLKLLDRMWSHPAYVAHYDVIVDVSNTVEWDLPPKDLRALAGTDNGEGPEPGRVAIVIGSDPWRMILAKLYKIFADLFSPNKQEVFKTFADAETWLGKPSKR